MQDFLMICRKSIQQLGDHPAMNSQGVPRRINSFVGLIELNINLQHPSFGANYSDYNDGRFWARDWVASGADPNTMKGNYPVIMLEEKATIMRGLKSSTEKKELILYSLDKNACDGCPPEIRSPQSAYKTALFWFKAFSKYVLSHEVIRLLPSGEEFWLTREEAQVMKDNEEIEDFRVSGVPMTSLWLNEGEFKLEPYSDGVLNGVRGYYTKILVNVCEVVEVQSDLSKVVWNRVAVQNCDSCQ